MKSFDMNIKNINTTLTKDQILSYGIWYLSTSCYIEETYMSKHRTIAEDGWAFCMKHYKISGFTEIFEEHASGEKIQIFRGYLTSFKDFQDIMRLLDILQGVQIKK